MHTYYTHTHSTLETLFIQFNFLSQDLCLLAQVSLKPAAILMITIGLLLLNYII